MQFGQKMAMEIDENLYRGYDSMATDAIASTVAAVASRPMRGFESSNLSSQLRPPTVHRMNDDHSMIRPLTGQLKGAGYSSRPKFQSNKAFDSHLRGPAPPLEHNIQKTPEAEAKALEKEAHRLLEQSAILNMEGKKQKALTHAKEAFSQIKKLCRHREQLGLEIEPSTNDLHYAVWFNLAVQFHDNGMYPEALREYSTLIKNQESMTGRLRVNMGNIYYEQENYAMALRMYNMALDFIGDTSPLMSFRIKRNIGNARVRLGQFPDAIQQYEAIMDQVPDAQTGYNLVVCYFFLGDKEKMKKGFEVLLSVQEREEYRFADLEEEDTKEQDGLLGGDELAKLQKERLQILSKFIHDAAKLIAPVIGEDVFAGYDWVIKALSNARRDDLPGALTQSTYNRIGMEMEIAKGIAYLKAGKIEKAITVFKSFEKRDSQLIDQAATNLAFLYFLEKDFKNGEKYAEMAVNADRYNAKALVNKANFMFVKGDVTGARELYLEANGVDSDCIEATYNLGLANKKRGNLDDALAAFQKLNRIIKDPQIIYQIADIHEKRKEYQEAINYFNILRSMTPTDPKVPSRLGELANLEGKPDQAFHYYNESYRIYKMDLDVIAWLGLWHVNNSNYEEATNFFERALEIETQSIKWGMFLATCHKRMENFTKALELYKKMHKEHPDHIGCLKELVALSRKLHDPRESIYQQTLLERQAHSSPQNGSVNEHSSSNERFTSERFTSERFTSEGFVSEKHTPSHQKRNSNPPPYPESTAQSNWSEPTEKNFAQSLNKEKGPTINQGKQREDDVCWEGGLDELLPS